LNADLARTVMWNCDHLPMDSPHTKAFLLLQVGLCALASRQCALIPDCVLLLHDSVLLLHDCVLLLHDCVTGSLRTIITPCERLWHGSALGVGPVNARPAGIEYLLLFYDCVLLLYNFVRLPHDCVLLLYDCALLLHDYVLQAMVDVSADKGLLHTTVRVCLKVYTVMKQGRTVMM